MLDNMSKKLLLLAAITVALIACRVEYIDVDFTTDPVVLRGPYAGTLEYDCLRQVSVAAWSPDGSRLATGSPKTLTLWNAATRTVVKISNPYSDLQNIVWNATKNEFTVLYANRATLERFDGATGARLGARVELPASAGQLLALSGDGRTALTQKNSYDANTDGLLQAWDVTTAQQLWTKNIGRVTYPNSATTYAVGLNPASIAFNPDGSRVAFVRDTETLIVALNSGATVTTIPRLSALTGGIAWRGANVALIENDAVSKAVTYDAQTGAKLAEVALSERVNAPRFSNDGQFLAALITSSNYLSFTLRVWNLETGAVVRDSPLPPVEQSLYGYTQPEPVYGFTPNNAAVLLGGTRQSCALDTLNLQIGARAAAFVLDTPELRNLSFTFQPTFSSESSYTVTGSVVGAPLDGYTISGTGYGGDCNTAIGGPTICDRWVQPQMSPPRPMYGRANLELTKPNAPNLKLEVYPLFPSAPDSTRWGAVMVDDKNYMLRINSVKP